MDLSTITIADFKARFYRDFDFAQVPSGAENVIPDPDFVQEQDIQNAFDSAMALLNQGLFTSDANVKIGYLLLSANCLCLNIRASNGGINSPANFPVAARTVGSVSESYGIPEAYLSNPILSTYTQTIYGLQYLQMVMPFMVGNIASVYGGTNA